MTTTPEPADPTQPETRDAPTARRARPPRWVRIFLAVGVVLLILVVVMLVSGHGPGRHMGHGAGLPGHLAW